MVFHQAAIRITQCAEEPRLALEVLADGTFNVLEAAVAADVRKVVAASSASVYGLATEFPTTESQHPWANDTLYGAAKVFNEGMLRSFHAMHGLDYVALRYFNVYGPRMDIHGLYTEVLIRWMERIEAGAPPLIFGDGQQTMDFVYTTDIARANLRAAEAPVTDAVFNIGSNTETSLLGLAEALLHAMGSDLSVEFGPERAGQRRDPPPGVHRRGAGTAGVEARGGPRGGAADPGRLLARRTQADMIPVMKPWIGEEEAEAAAAAVRSGWVAQGPRVAEFEASFAAHVGAAHGVAVSSCTTALHLALHLLGVGPGDEVVVPSFSFIATANCAVYVGATPVFADVEPTTETSARERWSRC